MEIPVRTRFTHPMSIFTQWTNVQSALHAYDYDLRQIQDAISHKESEETWDAIADAMNRLKAIVESISSEYPADTVALLRSLSQPINTAVCSERSRLSGAAVDLISASAECLQGYFDAALPVFLPTLLSLCSRPNKVFVTRARKCISDLILSTQSPSILPFLVREVKDKSVTLRLAVTDAALMCLETLDHSALQKEARARDIEALIKAMATDANADIRKLARKVFEVYKVVMPHRVDR